MTECPSEEELHTYAKSQNPFIDFPKIFRHLGSCGACTERYMYLLDKSRNGEQAFLPPKPSEESAQEVIEIRTWLDDQVIPDLLVLQKVTFDPPLVVHHGQKLVISFSLERNDESPQSKGRGPFTEIQGPASSS